MNAQPLGLSELVKTARDAVIRAVETEGDSRTVLENGVPLSIVIGTAIQRGWITAKQTTQEPTRNEVLTAALKELYEMQYYIGCVCTRLHQAFRE